MPRLALPTRTIFINPPTPADKSNTQKSRAELLSGLLEKEMRLQLEMTETRLKIDRLREERFVCFKGENGGEKEADRERKEMKRREDFRNECEAFSRGLKMRGVVKVEIGRSVWAFVGDGGGFKGREDEERRRRSTAEMEMGRAWGAVREWYEDYLRVVARK